jgi:hypothetical protein
MARWKVSNFNFERGVKTMLILFKRIFSFEFSKNPRTDQIGGDVNFFLPSVKGFADVTFNGVRGNPIIQFDASIGAIPNVVITLTSVDAQPVDTAFFEKSAVKVQELILVKDLTDTICQSLKEPGNPINPVFALYDGVYWIHDPRYVSLMVAQQTKLFQVGNAYTNEFF